MDKYTKIILTIIAAGVTLIALKLYSSPPFPTYGDFIALRQERDARIKREAHAQLLRRLPVLWIQGGQIDASVTGSVEIDR